MTDLDFFGRGLERAGLALAVATVVLGLCGAFLRDRRFVTASRRALIAGGLAAVGAAAMLVRAFFLGQYELEYVFGYSERKLDGVYKFAGLWAGLQGSILFWTMLLGVIGIVLAWSFRKRGMDPSGRRLEPYVYAVFAGVQVFFWTVICFVEDPFTPMSADMLAGLGSQGLLVNGVPGDGSGLTPLLENYWMTIHPPSVYLGFILYTVPFAFGMAALMAGEFSSYWIRTTRRWTLVAWLFNTNGVVLGGLWAYEVLGWGGYWAWDPVENASFLPWLTGTAFLHSVMIQERRDMLRVWNCVLIATTFLLSIFGTYLTRSGIVSSVHAFAGGDVGDWFLGFLFVIGFISLFFIVFRMQRLRSANRIDSLLSREGVFVLNNMVLCAIAGAIVVLTLWPKISMEFMRNPISVGVPVYNQVCTPFFVLLLFLTAIGPSTAWVRTSTSRFFRNLAWPASVALVLAVATQYLAYVVVRGGDGDDPVTMLDHVYPTFIVAFLGWWIIASLFWEFLRTTKNTARGSGAPWFASAVRVVTRNNRRYGGYVVHCGLAVLAIGVVCSSMYKVTKEVRVKEAGSARIGPYVLHVDDARRDVPISAYTATQVDVRLTRDGTEVAQMSPEQRWYPPTGYRARGEPMTTVEIHRRAGEDVYVYFQNAQSGGYVFTVFRNPLISLVWMGWLIMIAGGLLAMAPMGRKRIGLAE